MKIRIETKFRELHMQLEREKGRAIPIHEISNDTSVCEDSINLMSMSHVEDVSTVSIGEILRVAMYFNVSLQDFISIKKVSNANEIEEKNVFSRSHCKTGNEFRIALASSKYFETYSAVPGLIDSVADLIDKYKGRVLAGVVENFNLKLVDENVLVRFFAKDGKIFIKNVLFGKSIKFDNKGIYKEVYKCYFKQRNKDSVETPQDVDCLISAIEKHI